MDALPTPNGMAFIIVQHLDPSHDSMMVDLLAGHTSMPVLLATDGMKVERERVYVIPPGAYLAVDLALMTLVLPTRENEGRDLAVLSIANAGPQLLSPAISATIISLAGYDALFWFGLVVSLLAGVAVFFIRSVR